METSNALNTPDLLHLTAEKNNNYLSLEVIQNLCMNRNMEVYCKGRMTSPLARLPTTLLSVNSYYYYIYYSTMWLMSLTSQYLLFLGVFFI